MKLKKIKLVDKGYGGIILDGIEPVKGEDIVHLDDVQRERHVPVPGHVLNTFAPLKYFYLSITGHWIGAYDKYLDRNGYTISDPGDQDNIGKAYMALRALWDATVITQVVLDQKGFRFLGSIEAVENKPVSINTPRITIDDDLGFYSDAIDKIEECMKACFDFVNQVSLPSAEESRKYLTDRGSNKEKERVSDMSEDELTASVLDKIAEKGYIIIADETHQEELKAIESDEKISVHSSRSIDSERNPEFEPANTPEDKQEDDGYPDDPDESSIDEEAPWDDEGTNYQEPSPLHHDDEQVNPFGPPASERDFRELDPEKGKASPAGDLTPDEYSNTPENIEYPDDQTDPDDETEEFEQ